MTTTGALPTAEMKRSNSFWWYKLKMTYCNWSRGWWGMYLHHPYSPLTQTMQSISCFCDISCCVHHKYAAQTDVEKSMIWCSSDLLECKCRRGFLGTHTLILPQNKRETIVLAPHGTQFILHNSLPISFFCLILLKFYSSWTPSPSFSIMYLPDWILSLR